MEEQRLDADIDEYLWPLTGDTTQVDWSGLAEELQIRRRLGEIVAHVDAMHVQPRLRRLGPRPSPAAVAQATAAIITGPGNGPVWLRTLCDPVPRALREEWRQLTQRLQRFQAVR